MADMSKYASSAFNKIEDLEDGPKQGAIAKIVEGQYGKPVVTLDDGSKLSLNATNVSTLIRAFGKNDADWIGKRIELFAGELRYNGKDQAAVLVRALDEIPAAARTAPTAQPLRGVMDDEIPF